MRYWTISINISDYCSTGLSLTIVSDYLTIPTITLFDHLTIPTITLSDYLLLFYQFYVQDHKYCYRKSIHR